MARHRKKGIHGAGSVYPRKDGRWVASFIVEETGKRKDLYAKSEKEAWNKLQQALQEQKQGILATGPQQKLKDYLTQWLDEVHKPTIRLSTYIRYRYAMNKQILPALGDYQLQKITAQRVQTFYANLLKTGTSTSVVLVIHAILHKAFDNAVKWGLVARNVCDMVSPPRQEKREIRPLNMEEAQRLLEVARGRNLEALLTVALVTGMRHGELRGLHWQDINFGERSLSIRRTVGYLGGYGYLEREPKTAKGRRNIMLPDFVVELLKRHRTQQLETRHKAGDRWQEHDLVFCSRYGRFIHQSSVLRMFRNLLKEAGLPQDMHLHDLRHSAATILLCMGYIPKWCKNC